MRPSLDCSGAPILVAKFYPTLTAHELTAHFAELEHVAQAVGRVGVVVDLSDGPRAAEVLRSDAVREMGALFQRSAEKLGAVAHVVRSAPVRALLRSIQRLVPPPFPSLVTASREQATDWVRTELNADASSRAEQPQRRDARTAAGLLRTIVHAARDMDADVDTELARAGLSTAALADVDARVPYGALMDLVQTLAMRAGDDDFGLHVAERYLDAASFGAVGLAARSSTTIRDAIERTARFARLMNENTVMTLTDEPNGLRVVDGPLPPLEWPRHYAELAMAAFMTLARAWTGLEAPAAAVGFRHPTPASIAEHERVFGCVPVFSAPENFVVVPHALLERRPQHGDPFLAQYFDRRLDEAAQMQDVAPGPLGDLREATRVLLTEQTPTLEMAARKMGVSRRTLQRRLSERRATFSEVLDSVRREVALAAMSRPDVSLTELSTLCGYEDPKALRRAFVRWTGMSPRDYRRRKAH